MIFRNVKIECVILPHIFTLFLASFCSNAAALYSFDSRLHLMVPGLDTAKKSVSTVGSIGGHMLLKVVNNDPFSMGYGLDDKYVLTSTTFKRRSKQRRPKSRRKPKKRRLTSRRMKSKAAPKLRPSKGIRPIRRQLKTSSALRRRHPRKRTRTLTSHKQDSALLQKMINGLSPVRKGTALPRPTVAPPVRPLSERKYQLIAELLSLLSSEGHRALSFRPEGGQKSGLQTDVPSSKWSQHTTPTKEMVNMVKMMKAISLVTESIPSNPISVPTTTPAPMRVTLEAPPPPIAPTQAPTVPSTEAPCEASSENDGDGDDNDDDDTVGSLFPGCGGSSQTPSPFNETPDLILRETLDVDDFGSLQVNDGIETIDALDSYQADYEQITAVDCSEDVVDLT